MKTLAPTLKARVVFAGIVIVITQTLGFLSTVAYVSQVEARSEKQGREFRQATCSLVQAMMHEYESIDTANARNIAAVWGSLGVLLKCEERK